MAKQIICWAVPGVLQPTPIWGKGRKFYVVLCQQVKAGGGVGCGSASPHTEGRFGVRGFGAARTAGIKVSPALPAFPWGGGNPWVNTESPWTGGSPRGGGRDVL